MKFLIASDVHGSAFYMQMVVDAFKKEKCDKLILLGDVLYHGPRNELPKEYDPKKVAELLNGLKEKIICVRGNCDAEVDQMLLDFPILVENTFLVVEDRLVLLTHGHKLDGEFKGFADSSDVVISGHTHVPRYERWGNKLFLNPGSVSIPKEESDHSYIILDGKTAVWKNEDGDVVLQGEI